MTNLIIGKFFWIVFAESFYKSAFKMKCVVTGIETQEHDIEVEYVYLLEPSVFTFSNRPNKLHLRNFNYLDIKNTKKLDYLFFDEAEADKFIKSVQSGEIVAERLTIEDRAYGVHMSHCFQGNHCGCKYGEDDICPANPGLEALQRRNDNEIRKHLKQIFLDTYNENYLGVVTRKIDEDEFVFADPSIEEKFCIFVEGYKCYTKYPREDEYY